AATWSGFKGSGLGHTHGGEGLREFCRQRFVSSDELELEAPLFGFPYDAAAGKAASRAMAALHAPGRMKRLLNWIRLARQKRFRARAPVRKVLVSWKRRNG